MNSNESRPQGRRQGRGHQHRNNRNQRGPRESRTSDAPKKVTFWQKLISFFTGGRSKTPIKSKSQGERHSPRAPERVEVTSPKLYVGNLSYRACDSDLFDLFKAVGEVENAEIVIDRQTDGSKGFGFVTMQSVDDAKRAVEKLHDKDFMGRRLVVCGSKSESRRDF